MIIIIMIIIIIMMMIVIIMMVIAIVHALCSVGYIQLVRLPGPRREWWDSLESVKRSLRNIVYLRDITLLMQCAALPERLCSPVWVMALAGLFCSLVTRANHKSRRK